MKILIIKLSSLGDLLHAIPAANALKALDPNFEIDWLVYESFAKILKSQVSISNIIKISNKNLKNYIGAMNFIAQQKYDLIIDLQGLMKTGFLSLAANNLGFLYPRERFASVFYSHRFADARVENNKCHIIDTNLQLVQSYFPKLNLEANFGALNARVDNIKIFTRAWSDICIIPGTTWKTKLWPSDYWLEFLNFAKEKFNSKIYILGSNKDLLVIEEIVTKLKFPFHLVINKDLLELPDFFRSMSLIVGVDTGPLHLAAASCYKVLSNRTQIVSIHGPSSGSRTGAYGFLNLSADKIFATQARNKRSNDNSMQKIKANLLLELLQWI